MTTSSNEPLDVLDVFFAKVDAQPKKRGRGRPKNPTYTPPVRPAAPTYEERPDALFLTTRTTTCRGCSTTYRAPSHVAVRYREYTMNGKLRTKKGINTPVIHFVSFPSLGGVPSNLPVHHQEDNLAIDACEECVTSTYRHTQLQMPFFSVQDERELAAYNYALTTSETEEQKLRTAFNPKARAVAKDLERIRQAHPDLMAELKVDEQITLAAHHPDLLFPSDWMQTMIEDLQTTEMDQWLAARKETEE